jgi:glycosyltransferase involved in cell wall biosynthesis
MNCKNGENFINDSVGSLLQQSYKNWELIFWDNFSNDKSVKKIKSYNDERIKVYRSKKTITLGHARQNALKKCKGSYVSFLDVDDLWIKNKLKLQIKLFNSNKKLGLVFCNELFFSKNSQKIGYKKKNLPTGKIYTQLLNNYFISFSTVMVKMSVIKANKINFSRLFNHISDFDFVMKLSRVTYIDLLYQVLVKTRIHFNSGSYKQPENFFFEKRIFLSKLKKNNKSYFSKNKLFFLKFEKGYFREYLLNLIMLKRYKEIKKLISNNKFFNRKIVYNFLRLRFFIDILSVIIKKKRMYI